MSAKTPGQALYDSHFECPTAAAGWAHVSEPSRAEYEAKAMRVVRTAITEGYIAPYCCDHCDRAGDCSAIFIVEAAARAAWKADERWDDEVGSKPLRALEHARQEHEAARRAWDEAERKWAEAQANAGKDRGA